MAGNRIPKADLQKYSKAALKRWKARLFEVKELKKALPVNTSEELTVDLSLCSAREMTDINKQFRGKNKPTDVLSFPASEFFWAQGLLGDLVLCGDVALQQAREHKHTWKVEIDVLIVHGLLHLLGFDHEASAREAKAMEKLEAKVLNSKKSSLIKRSLIKRSLIKRAKN